MQMRGDAAQGDGGRRRLQGNTTSEGLIHTEIAFRGGGGSVDQMRPRKLATVPAAVKTM